MDKLTDILTTFFVNSKRHEKPQTNTKSEVSTSSSNHSTSSSSRSTSSSSTSTSIKKSKESEGKIQSEQQKEVQSEPNNDYHTDNIYSDLSSLHEKNTVSDIKSKVQEEQQDNETKREQADEQADEQAEEQADEQADDNGVGLKKYILKPSQFYKKNINIVTDGIEGGIEILSDLLYKLSLIKDVDKIYDNTIHIVSDIDNKKLYKQMLLDNPYLYFTNFDVTQTLSKRKVEESITDKRSIYIFDNNMVNKYNNIVNLIIDKNVHVFVLSNQEDKTGFDTFSSLGQNKILLYKPNKLKMIQKRFYKYYIKPLSMFSDFDTYYVTVNNEDLDLKYIIIKDNELRYN